MAYAERLGSELVSAVILKCADLGGHSWAYVRKALAEAESQGCRSAEEYRLTNPIGAGRNKRVDRTEPSGNDWLKNAPPPSAWNTKSDPVYVVENTMSVAGQKVINTTKLVLKARFFPEDFKDASDASRSATWFVFSSDSVGTHTELIS